MSRFIQHGDLVCVAGDGKTSDDKIYEVAYFDRNRKIVEVCHKSQYYNSMSIPLEQIWGVMTKRGY